LRKGLQKYGLSRRLPTLAWIFYQAPAGSNLWPGIAVCPEKFVHLNPASYWADLLRVLYSVLVSRLIHRFGLLTLALVALSATVALAATVTLFTASYDGANVRVEWEVSSESDVSGFDLYRKAASETAFTLVSNVVPTGQRRYQYLDANVYRQVAGANPTNPMATGPFTYRLTVHGTSGDQSYTAVLAGTPSAVQRSWGTIKSMFR